MYFLRDYFCGFQVVLAPACALLIKPSELVHLYSASNLKELVEICFTWTPLLLLSIQYLSEDWMQSGDHFFMPESGDACDTVN